MGREVFTALKYVAKAISAGLAGEFTGKFDLPTLRERLLSEDGMGQRVLLAIRYVAKAS